MVLIRARRSESERKGITGIHVARAEASVIGRYSMGNCIVVRPCSRVVYTNDESRMGGFFIGAIIGLIGESLSWLALKVES